MLGETLEESLLAYARAQNPEKMMMPELINQALLQITKNLKPTSIPQYNSNAKALREIFIEFSPQQVTSRNVAEIKQAYSDRPSKGNQLISLLKQVFQYAVEWGIIENNPAVGIRRQKETVRTRYITDSELNLILTNAKEPLKSIVTLCYYTGQRISDVLSIKKSDISDNGIYFTQQKTGQRLFIEFNDELLVIINNLAPTNSPFLLCTKKGDAHKYTAIQSSWARLMESLKIDDCHIHDLRAKSLTDAKKQGKNAQALGGHASESMTNRYIRSRDTITAQPPSIRQKK
jgi:integrase